MTIELSKDSLENKKKILPALDLARFVGALLVVMIHTFPLVDVNLYLNYGITNYIARLAVPFFFITSGYLCFKKTSYEQFDFSVPKQYAFRMLKLYVLWTVVYFIPFLIRSVYMCERGYVYGLVCAIRTFLFSGYHHLWYLSALAVAVFLVAGGVKRRLKMHTILIIGILLYMMGLLGKAYSFLLEPLKTVPVIGNILHLYNVVFETTVNGVFVGVVFVSIGVAFAYKRITIKYAYAILGFVISMILLLAEIGLVKCYGKILYSDVYIFLLPATFFLFYLVIHFEMQQSRITNSLRMYSMLIYFIHSWIDFPVISVINRIYANITGVKDYQMHSLLRFVIVLGVSMFLAKLILDLSQKEKFDWLRKFY